MCDEEQALLSNQEHEDTCDHITQSLGGKMEDVDGSCDLSKIQRLKQILINTVRSRYFWKALLLGQFISLLLCGTGVTSGLLADMGVHIPTAQSFVNYVLLCLTFTVVLACRRGDRNLMTCLKTMWWKYFLFAAADVEANFLVVKAYSYTTVTSVQLLDCFSIPSVMVLSYFFLHIRYKFVHIFGVIVCILGLGGLVLTDVLAGNGSTSSNETNIAVGDILCIVGALLYGVSNVAEEYVIKRFDRVEFLGMLGLFGSAINGVQFVLLERNEIVNLDFTSYKIVLLLLGFSIFQFLQYFLIAVIVQHTSATVFNLSILSADFYALLFGIFLFKYQFHVLYFISFVLILLGLGIYTTKPTTSSVDLQEQLVLDNKSSVQEVDSREENSGNDNITDIENSQ